MRIHAVALGALHALLTLGAAPAVSARLLSNPFNEHGKGQTNASSCRILAAQKLLDGNTGEDEDVVLECEMDPTDADGVQGTTRRIKGTAAQMTQLKEGLRNGAYKSGEARLSHGRGASYDKSEIRLPPGLDVSSSVTRGNRGQVRGGNRRLESRTTGDKAVLAIKVSDVNGLAHPDSASVMSDNIFGTAGDAVNLKTQMAACSFGQLNILPGLTGTVDGNDALEVGLGVIEVEIDVDITAVEDRIEVRNAVVAAAASKLGFNLPGPYDHVIFVLEGCYGPDCGWAAYAYINAYNSVFQGDFYAMATVQMHELGHNFNLAHSGGLDGQVYSDHTCSMGAPLESDDIGRMCYNGAKNWQLDWYDANGGKLLIDPTDPNFQSQLVTLVGIAEYDVKSQSNPVAIKLETGLGNDYFLSFNRATGNNADNVEADDEVTIVQVEDGNGLEYSQSYLKAHLAQGESYVISGLSLTVSVVSIAIASQSPGTAVICMTKTGDCSGAPSGPSPPSAPHTSSPTRLATSSPVSSTDNSASCPLQVASVLLPGDAVSTFGCTSFVAPENAIDGSTDVFECTKDPDENKKKFGLIVTPPPERASIVEFLRVYAASDCPECDPVSYKVEGKGGPNCFRVNNAGYEESNTFRLIRKGSLDWVNGITRNTAGTSISSTYASGDQGKTYAEVDLLNMIQDGTESECSEYRLTFSDTRDDAWPTIKLGEIELRGRITSACPPAVSTSPTVSPMASPTLLSASPTVSPTSSPTSSPSVSTKPSLTSIPTSMPSISSAPVCGSTTTANVFETGDTVATFGCANSTTIANAIDGTTNSFECVKNVTDGKHGIIVTPAGGIDTITSIAEKLRVYAATDCPECDPVGYKVEGRGGPNCFRSFDNIAESNTFRLINKGTLDWGTQFPRNTAGNIVSTYASGDPDKTYAEVDLMASGSDCSEYRITFGETRVDTFATPIKVGEVELVGRITSDCPTPSPIAGTTGPTSSPTHLPTTSPTVSLEPSLSSIPSLVPSTSSAPTCQRTFAASVLQPSDAVTTFGCSTVSEPGNAYDGTTNSFVCVKDIQVADNKYGIIVTPPNDRPSIVKALRVYAANDCEGCDPVSYKVEGRGGPNCFRSFDFIAESNTWRLINKGDLLWSNGTARNGAGQDIVSTYSSGDTNKTFAEANLFNTESECSEYQITFGNTRVSGSTAIKVGEVELVGRVTECQGASSASPTSSPTTSAKPTLTSKPSFVPSASSAPSCGITEAADVLAPGDSVVTFGCANPTSPENAIDGTTNSFECVKNVTDGKHGIIVTPAGGIDTRTSIAEKLRVYAATDRPECDPVEYKVEGRGGPNCFRSFDNIAESNTFRLINKGTLDWGTQFPRNTAGQDIISTYASGDPDKTYAEVDLMASGSDCSEYRITFGETRVNSSDTIKVGEVELVGKITSCTTPSPTTPVDPNSSSPTSSPTKAPTSAPVSRCSSNVINTLDFQSGTEFDSPSGVTGGASRPWAYNLDAGCNNTSQGLRAGENSNNAQGVDDESIYTISVPAGAKSMSFFYSYPQDLDASDDFHVEVDGTVVKSYEDGSGVTCAPDCVGVTPGGTVAFICRTTKNREVCSIDEIKFYD